MTNEPLTQRQKLDRDIEKMSKGKPIHQTHRLVVLAGYIRSLEEDKRVCVEALEFYERQSPKNKDGQLLTKVGNGDRNGWVVDDGMVAHKALSKLSHD